MTAKPMTAAEWKVKDDLTFNEFANEEACAYCEWSDERVGRYAAYRVRAALEEAMAEIRAKCGACNGTGGIGGGVHYVSREMASDAGEPQMEGMEIRDDPVECEYCGRPISVIRALMPEAKP